MSALVPIVIQMIPTVTAGVEDLIAFIEKQRAIAQQSNAWTPDLEAAFRQSLVDSGKDPAYLTDAIRGEKAA